MLAIRDHTTQRRCPPMVTMKRRSVRLSGSSGVALRMSDGCSYLPDCEGYIRNVDRRHVAELKRLGCRIVREELLTE
jgi:hypothetical protein